MEKDTKTLSKSFIETISSSELTNIGKDVIEIGIDKILTDGLLKDIPVMNVITGFWKTGVTIKDYRFITKLLYFLTESSKLTIKQRKEVIEKLENSEYQSEAGEKLISIIDNLDTKSKAKLVGKAINLFGSKIISCDEFWRISFIIEKLPLSDIKALKHWKETDLNKVHHIRKQLYLSLGVGWFVLDISSTGFVWTENICEIFSKYLITD